jgi:hypothetical protein
LAQKEYHGQDQICIGDGTCLNISHTGTALLPLSRRKSILNQLLHVPFICKNLLSVRKFSLDNSVFFEFHSSYFFIKEKQTGLLLHHRHLKDGPYQLLPSPSSSLSSPKNQALVGERTTPASWHKRLGHPAFRTVQRILSQFKLPVISNKAQLFCSACAQAKGHQLPFYPSISKVSKPLQLVHSDVGGPSPTISVNGNCYYVSFIDVFNRYTWVFSYSSKV